MSQLKGASVEVQVKLFHLLEEDFTKFKNAYQKVIEKKIKKRKSIDKKRCQLDQKVKFMLNTHSLDSEIKKNLLSLQQEIQNFT